MQSKGSEAYEGLAFDAFSPYTDISGEFIGGVDVEEIVFYLLQSLDPSIPYADSTALPATNSTGTNGEASEGDSTGGASDKLCDKVLGLVEAFLSLESLWKENKDDASATTLLSMSAEGFTGIDSNVSRKFKMLHRAESHGFFPSSLKTVLNLSEQREIAPLTGCIISLLGYAEDRTPLIVSAICAFLEVQAISEVHQVVLLMVLRIIVARFLIAQYQVSSCDGQVECTQNSTTTLKSEVLKYPAPVDARQNVENNFPDESTGLPSADNSGRSETYQLNGGEPPTTDLAYSVTELDFKLRRHTKQRCSARWEKDLLAFCLHEVGLLHSADKRRRLLTDILLLLARLRPKLVACRIIRLLKRGNGKCESKSSVSVLSDCQAMAYLHILSICFTIHGWMALPPSIYRSLISMLQQLLHKAMDSSTRPFKGCNWNMACATAEAFAALAVAASGTHEKMLLRCLDLENYNEIPSDVSSSFQNLSLTEQLYHLSKMTDGYWHCPSEVLPFVATAAERLLYVLLPKLLLLSAPNKCISAVMKTIQLFLQLPICVSVPPIAIPVSCRDVAASARYEPLLLLAQLIALHSSCLIAGLSVSEVLQHADQNVLPVEPLKEASMKDETTRNSFMSAANSATPTHGASFRRRNVRRKGDLSEAVGMIERDKCDESEELGTQIGSPVADDELRVEGSRAALFFQDVSEALDALITQLQQDPHQWRLVSLQGNLQVLLPLLLLQNSRLVLQKSKTDNALAAFMLDSMSPAIAISCISSLGSSVEAALPKNAPAVIGSATKAEALIRAVSSKNWTKGNAISRLGALEPILWKLLSADQAQDVMIASNKGCGELLDRIKYGNDVRLLLQQTHIDASVNICQDKTDFTDLGADISIQLNTYCCAGLLRLLCEGWNGMVAASSLATLLAPLEVCSLVPRSIGVIPPSTNLLVASITAVGFSAAGMHRLLLPLKLSLFARPSDFEEFYCSTEKQYSQGRHQTIFDQNYEYSKIEAFAKIVDSLAILASKKHLFPSVAAALLHTLWVMIHGKHLVSVSAYLETKMQEFEQEEQIPGLTRTAATIRILPARAAATEEGLLRVELPYVASAKRRRDARLRNRCWNPVEIMTCSSSSDEEYDIMRRRSDMRKWKRSIIQQHGDILLRRLQNIQNVTSTFDKETEQHRSTLVLPGQGSGHAYDEIGDISFWNGFRASEGVSGGGAWNALPPPTICSFILFCIRVLAIPPQDGGSIWQADADLVDSCCGEYVSGHNSKSAFLNDQLQDKRINLIKQASISDEFPPEATKIKREGAALLLREAATLIALDYIAPNVPGLLFPIVVRCIGELDLMYAQPILCCLLARMAAASHPNAIRYLPASSHFERTGKHINCSAEVNFPLSTKCSEIVSGAQVVMVSLGSISAQAYVISWLLFYAAVPNRSRALAAASLLALDQITPFLVPKGDSRSDIERITSNGNMIKQASMNPSNRANLMQALRCLLLEISTVGRPETLGGSSYWRGELNQLLLMLLTQKSNAYAGCKDSQIVLQLVYIRAFVAVAEELKPFWTSQETQTVQSKQHGSGISATQKCLLQQQALLHFVCVCFRDLPNVSAQLSAVRLALGCVTRNETSETIKPPQHSLVTMAWEAIRYRFSQKTQKSGGSFSVGSFFLGSGRTECNSDRISLRSPPGALWKSANDGTGKEDLNCNIETNNEQRISITTKHIHSLLEWLGSADGETILDQYLLPLPFFKVDRITVVDSLTHAQLQLAQATAANAVAIVSSNSEAYPYVQRYLQILGTAIKDKRKSSVFPFFYQSTQKTRDASNRALLMMTRAAVATAAPSYCFSPLVDRRRAWLISKSLDFKAANFATENVPIKPRSSSVLRWREIMNTAQFKCTEKVGLVNRARGALIQSAKNGMAALFAVAEPAISVDQLGELLLVQLSSLLSVPEIERQEPDVSIAECIAQCKYGKNLTLFTMLHLLTELLLHFYKSTDAQERVILLQCIRAVAKSFEFGCERAALEAIASDSVGSRKTVLEMMSWTGTWRSDAQELLSSGSSSGMWHSLSKKSLIEGFESFWGASFSTERSKASWNFAVDNSVEFSQRRNSAEMKNVGSDNSTLNQLWVNLVVSPAFRNSSSKFYQNLDLENEGLEQQSQALGVVCGAYRSFCELCICSLLPIVLNPSPENSASSFQVSETMIAKATQVWMRGAFGIGSDPLSPINSLAKPCSGSLCGTTATYVTQCLWVMSSLLLYNGAVAAASALNDCRHGEKVNLTDASGSPRLDFAHWNCIRPNDGLCCLMLLGALNANRMLVPSAATFALRGAFFQMVCNEDMAASVEGGNELKEQMELFKDLIILVDNEGRYITADMQSDNHTNDVSNELNPHDNRTMDPVGKYYGTYKLLSSTVVNSNASSGLERCLPEAYDSGMKKIESTFKGRGIFIPAHLVGRQNLHSLSSFEVVLNEQKNKAVEMINAGKCNAINYSAVDSSDSLILEGIEASGYLCCCLLKQNPQWAFGVLVLKAVHFRLSSSPNALLRWRGVRLWQRLLPLLPYICRGLEDGNVFDRKNQAKNGSKVDGDSRSASCDSNMSSCMNDAENDQKIELWLQLILLLIPKLNDSALQVRHEAEVALDHLMQLCYINDEVPNNIFEFRESSFTSLQRRALQVLLFSATSERIAHQIVSLLLLPMAEGDAPCAARALSVLRELIDAAICNLNKNEGDGKEHLKTVRHPSTTFETTIADTEVERRCNIKMEDGNDEFKCVQSSALFTTEIFAYITSAILSSIQRRRQRLERKKRQAASYKNTKLVGEGTNKGLKKKTSDAEACPSKTSTAVTPLSQMVEDAAQSVWLLQQVVNEQNLEEEATTLVMYLLKQKPDAVLNALTPGFEEDQKTVSASLGPVQCQSEYADECTSNMAHNEDENSRGSSIATAGSERKVCGAWKGISDRSPSPLSKLFRWHMGDMLQANLVQGTVWKGSCCMFSCQAAFQKSSGDLCAHYLLAGKIAEDKSSVARIFVHWSYTCNNGAGFKSCRDSAAAAGSLNPESLKIPVGSHQISLIMALLLSVEQRKCDSCTTVSRVVQLNFVPLFCTSLLRLATAHSEAYWEYLQLQRENPNFRSQQDTYIQNIWMEFIAGEADEDDMGTKSFHTSSFLTKTIYKMHVQSKGLCSLRILVAAEVFFSLCRVAKMTNLISILLSRNFLPRSLRHESFIGAVHDAFLLCALTRPTYIKPFVDFLSPFLNETLTQRRSTAAAALLACSEAIYCLCHSDSKQKILDATSSFPLLNEDMKKLDRQTAEWRSSRPHTSSESLQSKSYKQRTKSMQIPSNFETETMRTKDAANAAALIQKDEYTDLCDGFGLHIPENVLVTLFAGNAGSDGGKNSTRANLCSFFNLLLQISKLLPGCSAMCLEELEQCMKTLQNEEKVQGKHGSRSKIAALRSLDSSDIPTNNVNSILAAQDSAVLEFMCFGNIFSLFRTLTQLWISAHSYICGGGKPKIYGHEESVEFFGGNSHWDKIFEMLDMGYLLYFAFLSLSKAEIQTAADPSVVTGTERKRFCTPAYSSFVRLLNWISLLASVPKCCFPVVKNKKDCFPNRLLKFLLPRVLMPACVLPLLRLSPEYVCIALFKAIKVTARLLQRAHLADCCERELENVPPTNIGPKDKECDAIYTEEKNGTESKTYSREPSDEGNDISDISYLHSISVRKVDELLLTAAINVATTTNLLRAYEAASALIAILPLSCPYSYGKDCEEGISKEVLMTLWELVSTVRLTRTVTSRRHQVRFGRFSESRCDERWQSSPHDLRHLVEEGLVDPECNCIYLVDEFLDDFGYMDDEMGIQAGDRSSLAPVTIICARKRVEMLLKVLFPVLMIPQQFYDSDRKCCLCRSNEAADLGKKLMEISIAGGNLGPVISVIDHENLLLGHPKYIQLRNLCVRLQQLLQCCRVFYPPHCWGIRAAEHPILRQQRQEQEEHQQLRRIDWLFFGSLTDSQASQKLSASKTLKNVPGMTRDAALNAVDGAGFMRTFAGLIGKFDDDTEQISKSTSGVANNDEEYKVDTEDETVDDEAPVLRRWAATQWFLCERPVADLTMKVGSKGALRTSGQSRGEAEGKMSSVFSVGQTTGREGLLWPQLCVNDSTKMDTDSENVKLQVHHLLTRRGKSLWQSWGNRETMLFLAAACASVLLASETEEVTHRPEFKEFYLQDIVICTQGLAHCCSMQISGLLRYQSASVNDRRDRDTLRSFSNADLQTLKATAAIALGALNARIYAKQENDVHSVEN